MKTVAELTWKPPLNSQNTYLYLYIYLYIYIYILFKGAPQVPPNSQNSRPRTLICFPGPLSGASELRQAPVVAEHVERIDAPGWLLVASKNGGTLFGSPCNKDRRISGSLLGPLIFWKLPCSQKQAGVRGWAWASEGSGCQKPLRVRSPQNPNRGCVGLL